MRWGLREKANGKGWASVRKEWEAGRKGEREEEMEEVAWLAGPCYNVEVVAVRLIASIPT